jgi:hypothetical protein
MRGLPSWLYFDDLTPWLLIIRILIDECTIMIKKLRPASSNLKLCNKILSLFPNFAHTVLLFQRALIPMNCVYRRRGWEIMGYGLSEVWVKRGSTVLLSPERTVSSTGSSQLFPNTFTYSWSWDENISLFAKIVVEIQCCGSSRPDFESPYPFEFWWPIGCMPGAARECQGLAVQNLGWGHPPGCLIVE